jgi:hypothetical protein
MSIALTRKITDYSSKESFSFSFHCDRCGKEWRSRQIQLNEECFITIRPDKELWTLKHRAALDQANLEAHLHFNNCPVCGKWVCDDCYCAEEIKHGGVCTICNKCN